MTIATQKNNKVVLITGASAGLGKDFALRLLQEGFTVYGAARRIEKMTPITEAGGHTIAMDITNKDQIMAAVTQIIEEQGRIDILINNAGYGGHAPLEEADIDQARHQFEVNLFGLATLTQRVLPVMRDQKSGTIINISSIAGKMYSPLGGWYHASKHALEGWSDCLRLEVKPFGINVVIIEPGGIKTEFVDVAAENSIAYDPKSPYASMITSFNKAHKALELKMSEPHVITSLVMRAINSKRPHTRYHAGFLSGRMLFLRSLLTDRMFDRLINSML